MIASRADAGSGSRWVAVGDYTKATATAILTSADGVSWSPTPMPAPEPGAKLLTSGLSGVAWSGTQFTAVGDAGTVLGSPDGLTWSAYASGTSTPLYAVASSGERRVAVGGAPVFGVPQGIAITDR